jgi:hypothetical protein
MEADVLQEGAEKSVMDKPEKELSNLQELKKVYYCFFNYHLIGVVICWRQDISNALESIWNSGG